jgi:hypothetical protein
VSAQAGNAALRGGHGGVHIDAAGQLATWPVTAPVAGLKTSWARALLPRNVRWPLM